MPALTNTRERRDPAEIEITPAMVDAGEDAILCVVGGADLGGHFSASDLAVRVYRAMAIYRTGECPTTAALRTSEPDLSALLPTAESPVCLRPLGKSGLVLMLHCPPGQGLGMFLRLAKCSSPLALIQRALVSEAEPDDGVEPKPLSASQWETIRRSVRERYGIEVVQAAPDPSLLQAAPTDARAA